MVYKCCWKRETMYSFDPMFSVEIGKNTTYKLYFSFTVNWYVYMSVIPKCCPTRWISKLLWSFEIHRVGQYLANFTGLSGKENATIYKTGPIFTVLGYDKLSLVFTLHVSECIRDIYWPTLMPWRCQHHLEVRRRRMLSQISLAFFALILWSTSLLWS